MGMGTFRCCPLATGALLLLVFALISCQTAGAAPVTHRCALSLDATKGFKLDCKQLRDAPASCSLVVYYNITGELTVSKGKPLSPLPIEPPFGVPAKPLPPRPAWKSAQYNATEPQLNRTEPLYNATVWPMFYFYGGPSCSLVLTPHVSGVRLADAPGESTSVLAFGGGLNATLTGGHISDTEASSAVLVLAHSMLTVQGTNFTSNKVSKGAIYASWSSQLAVEHTTLANNTAQNEGAAMYLVGSSASVVDSHLLNNTAQQGGGAVYVKFSSLLIDSTELHGNTAPIGGAIAVYDNSRVDIADNSTLLNNEARIVKAQALGDPEKLGSYYTLGVGGAMYVEGSRVDISDCKLWGNRAVMDGGAVRMQLSRLSISNSSVDKNRAHRHGGAIYVGTDAQNSTVNSTLTVFNTTLDNNVAEANGGAIMLERRAHTSITNSTFNNSHAWSEGGGLCTVMAGGKDDDLNKTDDLQTALEVHHVFFNGTSADDKLFIGPYFWLNISGKNGTSGFDTDFNRTSTGIVWRRRLCGKGEFVAATNYCEECPSYQFSTIIGNPGHQQRNCTPATDAAHAPGGAVLVPVSGAWHGVNESLKDCTGCPMLKAAFGEVRKCPNPLACHHEPKHLADVHPDSQKRDRLSWLQYGRQLCSFAEGYEGVLCGECIRGFGMTAPFKCNRCVGSTSVPDGKLAQDGGQPSRAGISILYLVYWVALTCWMLFTVRSSMRTAGNKQQAKANMQTTAAAPATAAEKGPPTEKAAAREGGLDDTSPHNLQDQHAAPGGGDAGSAAGSPPSTKERSKSLDITKALIVYTQWGMLIMNLPVSWLPWATTASESPADASIPSAQGFTSSVERLIGLLFGRSASIDCFLQAWNLLQANNVQTIVRNTFARVTGSVIVVPVMLFLSVLLLQLLASALRRPFLRAVDRLCANSEFFRRHLSGMLVAPSAVAAAGRDPACRPGRGPDEESPDVGAVNSASSAGSKGSFLSGSVFGDEFTAGSSWEAFKDMVIATALASSMFVYLTIARAAFGLLLCVKVGSSQRWILDVRLQCPTSLPLTGWGVGAVFFGVVLLCGCLAWPVGIAWVLIQEAYKGRLLRVTSSGAVSSTGDTSEDAANAHSTARLAIRYADYAVDFDSLRIVPSAGGSGAVSPPPHPTFGSDAWMARLRMYAILTWDSILDLHRLTVALASVCVMLQEIHQLILMVLALGSYLLLVLLVKPWRASTVWRLQVLALAILIASCLGIMACAVGNANAYYSSSVYAKAIPWLVLVANLGYLVLLVVLLVRCVMHEVPRLADVREYLRKRWRKLRLRQQQPNQRAGRRASHPV